jgi:hypothetical protein
MNRRKFLGVGIGTMAVPLTNLVPEEVKAVEEENKVRRYRGLIPTSCGMFSVMPYDSAWKFYID